MSSELQDLFRFHGCPICTGVFASNLEDNFPPTNFSARSWNIGSGCICHSAEAKVATAQREHWGGVAGPTQPPYNLFRYSLTEGLSVCRHLVMKRNHHFSFTSSAKTIQGHMRCTYQVPIAIKTLVEFCAAKSSMQFPKKVQNFQCSLRSNWHADREYTLEQRPRPRSLDYETGYLTWWYICSRRYVSHQSHIAIWLSCYHWMM